MFCSNTLVITFSRHLNNSNWLGSSYAGKEAAIDIHESKKKKRFPKKFSILSLVLLILKKSRWIMELQLYGVFNSKTKLMF